MAANPLLADALLHVEMGFAVHPVWGTLPDGTCRCSKGKQCYKKPGKHPVSLHGFKDASTDPLRVTSMLNTPNVPNYGLVWPEDDREIVFLWDVDGDGWKAKIDALKATYGPLPPTKTTRTPSGGRHVFFRWPAGLPIPKRVTGKDDDELFGWIVRWPGKGYVVGPGSRINGSTYESVGGTEEIADFPVAWAEGSLAAVGDPATSTAPPLITVTGGGYEVPASIPSGSRHGVIRDFIASRWNKGIPKEEIEAAVRAVIVPRCVEPLDEARLREEIDHGFATAERKWETPGGSREYGEPPPTTGTSTAGFPDPPDPVAYDGTVGEIVALMAGHTTAPPVAILSTALTVLGILAPRYLDFHGRQPTAILTGIVAETGEGKGTSMTFVGNAIQQSLGLWFAHRLDGMGSGEGFVRALVTRRAGILDKDGKTYRVMPVDPVNVVAVEEELASFMTKRGRDGSTLDHEVRKSFDSTRLSTGKSDSQVHLDPPYWFGSVGHITPRELREKVGSLSNGSANRWLWIAARGLDAPADGTFPTVPSDLRSRLVKARDTSVRDSSSPLILLDPARALIDDYRKWIMALPGSRDLTTRLPIIALRIAMIHCVLDGYIAVSASHVARGIALTEYGRAGIGWVYGPATGDRRTDTLAIAIRESEDGLTGREAERLIRDATDRRESVERLVEMGLVRVEKRVRPGGGNPALVHVWTGIGAGSEVRFTP